MSTDEDSADNDDNDLDRDLIRRYIAYLRDHVDPVIPDDDDVTSKIKWTYSKIREHASGRGLPVDPRIASALARISRAHARLCGSEQVAEADVDVAVNLMESSLMQLGVLDEMLESTDTMSVSEAAARADLSSADEQSVSQSERREAIVEAVERLNDGGESTDRESVYESLDVDINADTFRDEWNSLMNSGTLCATAEGEAEVLGL
jgi:DNA replicative helicase MCM subunit Mcm2 (Cdc46/Mcm family)